MRCLGGPKLLMPQPKGGLDADLSPEGRAVLVMLAPPGTPDQDERDRLIAVQERASLHLQDRFGRKSIAGQPAIVLARVDLGPNMPLIRVLRSVTFAGDHARRRMLFWPH